MLRDFTAPRRLFKLAQNLKPDILFQSDRFTNALIQHRPKQSIFVIPFQPPVNAFCARPVHILQPLKKPVQIRTKLLIGALR